MQDTLKESRDKMEKAIDALKVALAKLRTGRAHPSLLEQVMVSYYGSDVPLSQAANITVEDARTLSISPWDKTMVAPIEKAIMASNLGLNPSTAGTNIRIPMPPLTEERRRDLSKLVKSEAETIRVSIRNIRRDMISEFKALEKEKLLSEDDLRKAEEKAQDLTNEFVKQVDLLAQEKERDLMEI